MNNERGLRTVLFFFFFYWASRPGRPLSPLLPTVLRTPHTRCNPKPKRKPKFENEIKTIKGGGKVRKRCGQQERRKKTDKGRKKKKKKEKANSRQNQILKTKPSRDNDHKQNHKTTSRQATRVAINRPPHPLLKQVFFFFLREGRRRKASLSEA